MGECWLLPSLRTPQECGRAARRAVQATSLNILSRTPCPIQTRIRYPTSCQRRLYGGQNSRMDTTAPFRMHRPRCGVRRRCLHRRDRCLYSSRRKLSLPCHRQSPRFSPPRSFGDSRDALVTFNLLWAPAVPGHCRPSTDGRVVLPGEETEVAVVQDGASFSPKDVASLTYKG